MLRALFRGGFIGGTVAFLAAAFLLPRLLAGPAATPRPFPNEAAATTFLQAQTPASGVYQLPNLMRLPAGLPPDSAAAYQERQLAASARGPVAVLALRAQGQNLLNPVWNLASWLVHLVAALLLTLAGLALGHRPFALRWGALCAAAAAMILANQLPYWIQWHFGASWTLAVMGGQLAAWAAAALVIAWATGAGSGFSPLAKPPGRD